ncbi:large ribosomal subunit protein mL43 [Parasteatoda tepidariorum]|uniref:large ribosomal subunit protein mL43 n=1 Tax=Parasteatoda tepidariorum TaxID=114398 RepID=UPI001C71AD1C|nr:39S ribosomal protein L43, mitochondrial-like [Parasteatoda tepidariorum]
MSNQVYSGCSTYLKSVLQNGIGRYICQLQRVTFRFSKSHGGSRGLREFLEKDLMDLVRNNPGVVVYLKPRRIGPPSITAEYLNGHSHYHSFPRKPREEIVKWVEYMFTQSGFPTSRFINNHHTDTPSIQGVWTPFTHKPTWLNMTQFPNEDLSKAKTFFPNATEQLLDIASNCNSETVETEHIKSTE